MVGGYAFMHQAGKFSSTLAAAASAVALFGSPALAQGTLIPDLAFEGVDGLIQILADRRLERAGRMMAGKGAMVPRNDMTGMSGANGPSGMTAWGAVGGIHLSSRIPDAQYSGSHYNGAVGADMAVAPWLIAGLSLSWEARRLDTFFNQGTLETTGGTI